jgi:succinyl-CoA synthetase alpha subunit
MSILIDENTRVIVQGITGREGSLRSKYMKDYGTRVLAGTSPGSGGEEMNGIPIYNTVKGGD